MTLQNESALSGPKHVLMPILQGPLPAQPLKGQLRQVFQAHAGAHHASGKHRQPVKVILCSQRRRVCRQHRLDAQLQAASTGLVTGSLLHIAQVLLSERLQTIMVGASQCSHWRLHLQEVSKVSTMQNPKRRSHCDLCPPCVGRSHYNGQ